MEMLNNSKNINVKFTKKEIQMIDCHIKYIQPP